MATWQGVANRLGVQASGMGGGTGYGILLQNPTTKEWFQASDIVGTVGWIVTTDDGKTVDSWLSKQTMDDYNDILLAEYVKDWAARMGFVFPRRK